MYKKQVFIGSNDVDFNLELKMSSLFKIFQDVAVDHAEQLGVGKAKTIDLGMAWIITRFNVKIYDIPKYLQTVEVITYPVINTKFIFPRYFAIKDLDGSLLVEATSSWIVINSSTRRIVLNPFLDFIWPNEELPNTITLPNKVISTDSSLIEERLVRYSDTDLNGHMNNTRYIDYIIDLHDLDFYKENKVKSILINFNKELKNNDIVKLYSNREIKEYIKGEVDSNNVFDVEIEFIKR